MLIRHERHLKKAANIARMSTERYQHGVVIAKGNRILSVGINTHRNVHSNVSEPKREAGIHAEISAIKALPRDIDYRRLTLYSARVLKNGEWGLAKPCAFCQDMIDILGFRDVYWTE